MNEVDQSILSAYANSNTDWRIMAEHRISQLAKRKNPFTSEDIIRYLEYRGLETPNLSALGAMFRSRADAKEIKAVGWQTATRKERHKAPIRVWRGV